MQREVIPARDVDQQRPHLLDRQALEEGIGDGGFGRRDGAAGALGFAGAHHRATHARDDRAHIGKIEVDEPGPHDQVTDRPDRVLEHAVGHAEGLREGGLFVGHLEQVLVRNNQQGIEMAVQLLQAGFGHAHAFGAFEGERLGHYADDEAAVFVGGLRDHRRAAGARAATHAGGDEDHVKAFECGP